MARKPTKARPKQDHRTITPARRAVLYDQWLAGRSLEELSAKWRKPMHRVNEALVMERAERKMAQSIKDRDQRKENHEIGIIAPIETALSYSEVDAALTRMEDENRPTIEGAVVPNDVVEFRDPTTGERLGAIINVAAPEPARPVADLIEAAIRKRLG